MDYVKSADAIIRQDLGEPACLAEYLWMGDLYNSLCYRAIYEAANKVRPAQRRHAHLEDQRGLAERGAAGVRLAAAVQRRLLRHAFGLPAAARPARRRRLDGPGRQHAGRTAPEPEGAASR